VQELTDPLDPPKPKRREGGQEKIRIKRRFRLWWLDARLALAQGLMESVRIDLHQGHLECSQKGKFYECTRLPPRH
jgi:hypothetical protein